MTISAQIIGKKIVAQLGVRGAAAALSPDITAYLTSVLASTDADAALTSGDRAAIAAMMVVVQSAQAATAVLATAVQAMLNGGPYADEPTGRAAVADGASFFVKGATASDPLLLYTRVSAGVVSTLIWKAPSADAINALDTRVTAIEPVADAVSAFLNPYPDKVPIITTTDPDTGVKTGDLLYMQTQADGTDVPVAPWTKRLDILERGGSGIPQPLLSPVLSGDIQMGEDGGFFGGAGAEKNGFVEVGPVPEEDFSYDNPGAEGARKIYISKPGIEKFSVTADLPGDNYGVARFSNGITWHNSNGGTVGPRQSFCWTNGFAPGAISDDVDTIWGIIGEGQSTEAGIKSFDLMNGTVLTSSCPLAGRIGMFNRSYDGTLRGPRLGELDNGGPPQQFEVLDPLHLHTVVQASEAKIALSGETPLCQFAREFLIRMPPNHGAIIGGVPVGSMSFAAIGPGTTQRANAKKFIKRVREIALMNGKKFGGVIVDWPEHEGDATASQIAYHNNIIANKADWDGFITELTADDGPNAITSVFMVMNALTNGGIENALTNDQGLAQVQAATDPATRAAIGVGAPCYVFTRDPTDGAHFDKDGSPFTGAMRGRCAARLVLGQDAQPLCATGINQNGNVLTFPMHLPLGAAGLASVSPYVSDPNGAWGIRFIRQDNGIAVPFTPSFSGNALQVTANSPPAGVFCEVSWAYHNVLGAHGGPNSGSRSTINATSADRTAYDRDMSDHLVPQRFANIMF